MAAITGPLLFFTGFLLLATGHDPWAPLPVVLGGVLALCFPILEIIGAKPPKSERGVRLWGRILAFGLTSFWILQIPEAGALIDRVLGGALWDWKIIAAASLWTLLAIHSNLHAVSRMTDEMIYRHLAKGQAPDQE